MNNTKNRNDRKLNINRARHSVLTLNSNYGSMVKEDREFHEAHLAKVREMDR